MVGPVRCDLQTCYKLCCQFGSNFGVIQRGCTNCDCPGKELGDLNKIHDLTTKTDTIKHIEETRDIIFKESTKHYTTAQQKMKLYSVHPVLVIFFYKKVTNKK